MIGAKNEKFLLIWVFVDLVIWTPELGDSNNQIPINPRIPKSPTKKTPATPNGIAGV